MPEAINMGPGRGQKHRARTALLPIEAAHAAMVKPNVTLF